MMAALSYKVPVPRWFLLVFVVMALTSTGYVAWNSWEDQKCNEAFTQNLAARSTWADRDREAFQGLIVSVFEDGGSEAQAEAYLEWRDTKTIPELNALIEASFEGSSDPGGQQAYQTWKRVTERNDRLRAQVSLPELADCD
jgi:hypothetical protein